MIKDQFGNTWYKGNWHTHTTASDGRSAPEDTLQLYRENGYDFIALTDHYKWRPESLEENGILCLSGAEYDTGADVWEGVYHVTAIGCTEEPKLSREPQKASVVEIMDEIHRCGGIAILAHPAWSLNTPEQLEKLPMDGVEIYNTVSGRPWNCRPESGAIVDQLAVKGVFPRCIAADDTHFYEGDQCRSYIMVKAKERTREAILQAFLAGDYYATQGPEFSVAVEGDEVVVRSSPVFDVIFYTNMPWTPKRVVRGENVTEARYLIKGGDRFVRVELVDAEDNHAWSPAIPVNGWPENK